MLQLARKKRIQRRTKHQRHKEIESYQRLKREMERESELVRKKRATNEATRKNETVAENWLILVMCLYNSLRLSRVTEKREMHSACDSKQRGKTSFRCFVLACSRLCLCISCVSASQECINTAENGVCDYIK